MMGSSGLLAHSITLLGFLVLLLGIWVSLRGQTSTVVNAGGKGEHRVLSNHGQGWAVTSGSPQGFAMGAWQA